MAPHETIQTVRLLSVDGKESAGRVRIQHWDERTRTKRAAKALGLCWSIALVSVIIPLAHFVLVPGFLLAGPVVAFFIHGQASMVLGGEGQCPRCQALFQVAKKSPNWPLSDLCTACHSEIKIEPT